VHAHDFITQLPDGYQAAVRERGASLSGGQRQLISFARALAANPDVLVLDEATASVDPRTEALIQQALQRLLQGRTSLVIAHRLSTVQDASRVVVLHHGQVREIGTHAELMAARGIYYRLHQLQYFGARPSSTVPVRDWLDEPTETAIDPRFGIA
jgi:ATP-binding cassette subfamily B protein